MAKLVRWSHSHTVPLLPLDTTRQPSADQLPPKSLDLKEFKDVQIKTVFPISKFIFIFTKHKLVIPDSTTLTRVQLKSWNNYGILSMTSLLFKVPINAFLDRLHICWLKDTKFCFKTFRRSENFQFQFEMFPWHVSSSHKINDRIFFISIYHTSE